MASISTLPIPNRFPDPFTTEPHVPERVIGEDALRKAVQCGERSFVELMEGVAAPLLLLG